VNTFSFQLFKNGRLNWCDRLNALPVNGSEQQTGFKAMLALFRKVRFTSLTVLVAPNHRVICPVVGIRLDLSTTISHDAQCVIMASQSAVSSCVK